MESVVLFQRIQGSWSPDDLGAGVSYEVFFNDPSDGTPQYINFQNDFSNPVPAAMVAAFEDAGYTFDTP
jgi:hypothetical protein